MIEHRGAERELALHVNQPRALSQVLREAREDERRHLARELHDRVVPMARKDRVPLYSLHETTNDLLAVRFR